MANCSFIKATEARTRARNDTLIWTEISEIQVAILAAIDGNPCATPPVAGAYSTIIADGTPFTEMQTITAVDITSGGTLYDTTTATGLTGTLDGIAYTTGIAANGTNGTGAAVTPTVSNGVITSFIVNNSGSGYTPVSTTASVQAASNLTDSQDETSYTSRFAAGDDYFATETITLNENSTVTVDTISATGAVTIVAQTDADYDGGVGNGTIDSTGSGYAALEQITLDDGTVIRVDTLSGSSVATFTILSSSTTSFTSGTQRIQSSSTGTGIGFAITPNATNNETAVGTVTEFTVNSAGVDPFFLGQTVTQTSTTGIGAGFNLVPTATNATTITHGGDTAILTPIVTNGIVTTVVVNNGGTLYTAGQPVTISHPALGSGATAAVASVDGSGTIEAVTVITGGTNYNTVNALVAVDHPTGSNFEGIVTLGSVNTSNDYTSLSFSNGASTITRTGGTGFVTDGLLNGQTITISNAEDSNNDGTYTISNVTETVITVSETIDTDNADDEAALISKPSGVTGISIQDGGFGYADIYPTVDITDIGTPAGSGASIRITAITSGGVINGVSLDDGGSGYSQSTTATVLPIDGDLDASGAVLTLTVGTNTFGASPTTIYSVWSGQTTDTVIADQIQYVLDYFTALGYNIRAQVNPATANTLQWQIIW